MKLAIVLILYCDVVFSKEAKNFDENLLITIDDFRNSYGIDFELDREYFLDNSDFRSKDKKNYFRKYVFTNANLYLANLFLVAHDEAEATRFYVEYQAGVVKKMAENFSYTFKESELSNGGKVTFYTWYLAEEQPTGNLVMIRIKDKAYSLSVQGAFFENYAHLEEVYGNKIQAMFSHTPIF